MTGFFAGFRKTKSAPNPPSSVVSPPSTPPSIPVVTPAPVASPPNLDHIPGIDISRWQLGLNWSSVLAAGKKFAYIKATDGMSRETSFSEFRSSGRTMGLFVGAYHFFRFSDDYEVQARNFMSAVGQVQPGELPPMIDVEWDKLSKYGEGKTMDAEAYMKLLGTIKLIELWCGMPPVIYTNPFFFTSRDPVPIEFEKYPLWISGYVSSLSKVRIPRPWNKATFWQYSEKENVANSGVSGIDGDYFIGTMQELQALCKK